jgi:hypothetical protein
MMRNSGFTNNKGSHLSIQEIKEILKISRTNSIIFKPLLIFIKNNLISMKSKINNKLKNILKMDFVSSLDKPSLK